MGNTDSRTKDIELVAQAEPVVAIDPRHCAPQLVTLQESSSFFSTKRTYVDVQTTATSFEVQGQMLSTRMTLLAADKTPIVNYKGKSFSNQQTLYVRTGGDKDSEPILEIAAWYDNAEGSGVSIVFDNLQSGAQCEIGFVGNWRRRDAYIWLDRGRNGTKEPVAKIYCPEGVSRDTFHFDIAANMDTALIVMICAIMADKQAIGALGNTSGATIGTNTAVMASF